MEYDKRIYMASLSDLLTLLEETKPEYNRLLLIGHNPGFEQLLDYLSSAPIVVDDANGSIGPFIDA